jgi:hypothetical protein
LEDGVTGFIVEIPVLPTCPCRKEIGYARPAITPCEEFGGDLTIAVIWPEQVSILQERRLCVRCQGTAMSQPRDDRQDDLFRPALEKIINLRHPPVHLAAEIDWGFLAGRFGLSRRAWATAIADPAGGCAVHSQAYAQSVGRDAMQPIG